MRVLFAIFPATAHLHPIVPLAWALQSAGHEVVVAAHEGVVEPDLHGNIAASGLTGLKLGTRDEFPGRLGPEQGEGKPDRPSLALDHQGGDGWQYTRAVLGGMFSMHYPAEPEGGGDRRPVTDALVDFARAWRPDLVLWDPLMLPAPVAARACGAAHARLLWGMDNIGLIRRLTRQEIADPASSLTEDPWLPWLLPMLERYGLDFHEEMLTGQWSLDLTPPRMQYPLGLTTVPLRRVPYSGSAPLADWLHSRPERPRVVLTLGVSRRRIFGNYSGFPMREFFDSVSGLDLEVVATLNGGQLNEVGTLPDNVRALEYIPLNQVMPTSSAVIHHGGGGTFASAVAFKVPQLVVPLPMWDEAVRGRYVAERGAGLVADPEKLEVDQLRAQLVRLLEDPSFRDGTRDLHQDMLAAPAPREIIPLLERLTAECRG
ncbi:nucleotide disphospho-sugar-binding domain-containing protein [Streptomyces sp. NPDC052396]|uniref:nucleotide disphospho-sugar-binding domain-containing protein n=1 Tax=Streptomyces sp. NPDC052396 TaxID=3365689 RepID=UPI0037D3AA3C